MEKETINNILITAITPYFLEKGFVWFQENLPEILKARKTQTFWQDNTLFLEKDQKTSISEILKKIDEMGYEKVFKITDPGEFSQVGGIIEIFPVNLAFAVRLDFLGNILEAIEKLPVEITDEETSRKILNKKLKSQKVFSDLKGLKPGDYLVHLDHGISRFLGEKQIEEKRYYILEYAANDKLYVPFGLERKLSRYIGFNEPKLSRLGGVLWQKTKQKIKEEAEKFAKELLAVFAQKEISHRPVYSRDEFSQALEENFPFELTIDQKHVLEEIAADLDKTTPADRIVCGDVGFGKTEIALRTAALVAENNRQVALICPTAILASQHFATFRSRLKNLPLNIALLSRLQTADERRKIIAGLKNGEIDIIIGTHSILAKNVEFKNLGLLIIDDEQKFGVKQKEKLRSQNPALDVIYLSATPIPRTLYLALSSLKEISFIQTPPEGRKAVKTFVLPFKREAVKKAIESEISRGGQIYFLHNRVETIAAVKQYLADLKTKARIAILHAKLSDKEIIRTMNEFQQGEVDLLLSTTIIENGLDIARANTLIVDNATRLGLAQAYQLRGRIGRSSRQADAYFFYPKGQLKGLAKKRLAALKQAEELGSGYRIATADLEIRGAGNILGREQSGSVNRIGLNLYCQMLSEAVEKIKAK
ncbi:MAG: CarD family transcriptional regulator [Candidatus Pacebacteria bacterium]|nr:CarD family transcriptional regulator [Candidatus Paceibacterota bacterium]